MFRREDYSGIFSDAGVRVLTRTIMALMACLFAVWLVRLPGTFAREGEWVRSEAGLRTPTEQEASEFQDIILSYGHHCEKISHLSDWSMYKDRFLYARRVICTSDGIDPVYALVLRRSDGRRTFITTWPRDRMTLLKTRLMEMFVSINRR